tara:strand:+ start:1207 stop:2151 length:945 start_codon:yes stop_codon:yes gene_type:complete
MATKQELMTTEQQKAIIDTNNIVDRLEPVIDEIATIKALRCVGKMLTVSSLVKIKKLKESKSYIGMPYINDIGERAHVSSWAECCEFKLKIPLSTINKELLNLKEFGEQFYEDAKRIGLGDRTLRKLRQAPKETQELIINSEVIKLGSKEDIKEFIEDKFAKHEAELAKEKQRADKAEQAEKAVRANSDEKQQELDKIKERQAEMRFDQSQLSEKTSGLIDGITMAGVLFTQATNQLSDIFAELLGAELGDNEKEYLARRLVYETMNSRKFLSEKTNDILGTFGELLAPQDSLHKDNHEYENLPGFEEFMQKDP